MSSENSEKEDSFSGGSATTTTIPNLNTPLNITSIGSNSVGAPCLACHFDAVFFHSARSGIEILYEVKEGLRVAGLGATGMEIYVDGGIRRGSDIFKVHDRPFCVLLY